jgi:hypothetical protein
VKSQKARFDIWYFGASSALYVPNPILNIWRFGSASTSFAPNARCVTFAPPDERDTKGAAQGQ